MTNLQPQWRYVPFVSTLLMCSGLFMLLQGAPAQPARAFGDIRACDGSTAPGMPPSVARAPIGEDLDSRDSRADGAQPFISASMQLSADTDPLDDVIAVDASPWSSLRFRALWLRGPPSHDDVESHRLGTGPVDSSLDAADDDDDGDDDPDTDDGDGPATLVTASAGVSCTLHTSSLLSRVEVHHPVSFASDVQSLRAPPQ